MNYKRLFERIRVSINAIPSLDPNQKATVNAVILQSLLQESEMLTLESKADLIEISDKVIEQNKIKQQ